MHTSDGTINRFGTAATPKKSEATVNLCIFLWSNITHKMALQRKSLNTFVVTIMAIFGWDKNNIYTRYWLVCGYIILHREEYIQPTHLMVEQSRALLFYSTGSFSANESYIVWGDFDKLLLTFPFWWGIFSIRLWIIIFIQPQFSFSIHFW